MKPFNLEQALAGAPVMFRNGDVVDEFFYSKTLKNQPIISIARSYIRQHNKDGIYLVDDRESDYDLVMAPVKREGWVIKRNDNDAAILSTTIFDTEKSAALALSGEQYVYIKIEWEE